MVRGAPKAYAIFSRFRPRRKGTDMGGATWGPEPSGNVGHVPDLVGKAGCGFFARAKSLLGPKFPAPSQQGILMQAIEWPRRSALDENGFVQDMRIPCTFPC